MSMIGCFCAVEGEDLETIIKNPKWLHLLSGPPPPQKPSLSVARVARCAE